MFFAGVKMAQAVECQFDGAILALDLLSMTCNKLLKLIDCNMGRLILQPAPTVFATVCILFS